MSRERSQMRSVSAGLYTDDQVAGECGGGIYLLYKGSVCSLWQIREVALVLEVKAMLLFFISVPAFCE